MRFIILLVVVLLAPFLSGCVRTIQPILKDDQVLPIDKSLFGRWVSPNSFESVDVQSAERDNTYRVLYIHGDEKGTFLVRLGKVGDLTIAELHPDSAAYAGNDEYKHDLVPVFSFLIIRQTKPTILYTSLKQDWFNTYVDDHPNELQIIRRVDPDHFADRADDLHIVSSSTVDFQAFLLRHYKDDGAITDQGTFVRPDDPSTQPAASAK